MKTRWQREQAARVADKTGPRFLQQIKPKDPGETAGPEEKPSSTYEAFMREAEEVRQMIADEYERNRKRSEERSQRPPGPSLRERDGRARRIIWHKQRKIT